ncbi:unnamed protein product [Brassica rapa]|uniref:Complex 1 LYR protein domain-containing protein n=1 Tax=Brassica campestris TaxID=3711 RepID=A0A3P6AI99_BRACM|nr:unnamed protein product [Brassica rapa]VDC88939.1 unnamed protein product [Brassica rapa]
MLMMAAKLRKWRNMSTRIDLMLRSDATPSEERETANQRRGGGVLYRDILRATRFYTWTDSRGVLWRDVLRENARKEFEAARFETDPEVITRLLIGGSDAVSSALDRLAEKQREMIEKRNRGDQP